MMREPRENKEDRLYRQASSAAACALARKIECETEQGESWLKALKDPGTDWIDIPLPVLTGKPAAEDGRPKGDKGSKNEASRC